MNLLVLAFVVTDFSLSQSSIGSNQPFFGRLALTDCTGSVVDLQYISPRSSCVAPRGGYALLVARIY